MKIMLTETLSIIFIKIPLQENTSNWVTETVAGDGQSRSYVQVKFRGLHFISC